MKKTFEDQFMDIQSRLISLCLELVENRADFIYAYVSVVGNAYTFNAFYRINGQIKVLDELGQESALLSQFLRLGARDVGDMRKLFLKNKRRIPTRMLMYYDVHTGQFRVDYQYDDSPEEIQSERMDEVFFEWIRRAKQGLE